MNVYDMKIHESFCIPECPRIYVARVPGGWLYVTPETSTFVTYHTEFQEVKRERDA